MAYDRLTTLVVDVLPWVKMRHQNWWTLDRTWELDGTPLVIRTKIGISFSHDMFYVTQHSSAGWR